MNTPRVSAVCTVFLAPHLAQGGLVRGADLVDHPVLELVSANSVSDDRNFILWQSDGLAASGTEVTTHWMTCTLPSKARSVNFSGSGSKNLSDVDSEPLRAPWHNLL
jgi:hypothetical protein